jgi:hypothetical protein
MALLLSESLAGTQSVVRQQPFDAGKRLRRWLAFQQHQISRGYLQTLLLFDGINQHDAVCARRGRFDQRQGGKRIASVSAREAGFGHGDERIGYAGKRESYEDADEPASC